MNAAEIPLKCSDEQNVESPETEITVIEDEPFDEFKIHIKPQKIRLKLRRGEEYKLNFTYKLPKNYPIDLYYLMDFSKSMHVSVGQLSNLSNSIAETMKTLTNNFKLGFGSFIDKSIMPFGDYRNTLANSDSTIINKMKEYSFQNNLALQTSPKTFQTQLVAAIKEERTGSLDHPEGGLDALMQAIVCPNIGWRKHTRHLLVFLTNDGFHIAGDGKLAGIVIPNDGKCHMENNFYTHNFLQDYPSIGQINEKANDHNINVIFAVTKSQQEIYTALTQEIAESYIGELSTNSSSIVELVKDIYTIIINSASVADNLNIDKNINIEYFTFCKGDKLQNIKKCDSNTAEFTTKIKLDSCPTDKNFKTNFDISITGIDAKLNIDLEMLCQCPCENPNNIRKESETCSWNGDLVCGMCDCKKGKIGDICQCDETDIKLTDSRNCYQNNSNEECSGLGICKCGTCDCKIANIAEKKVYGKYCECTNQACKRVDGDLCSLHGECDCGTCNCHSGWTGEACECSTDKTTCRGTDGSICSRKGECVCGKCQCKEKNGYHISGTFCEECHNCPGEICKLLQNCMRMYWLDIVDKNRCNYTLNIIPVDGVEASEIMNICSFPDNSGCSYKFGFNTTVPEITSNILPEITIYAMKDKVCPKVVPPIARAALLSGIIISIVIAGLVLILIIKTFVYYHDRREYNKFETERKKTGWNNEENPLYKDPLSHFQNPLYDNKEY